MAGEAWDSACSHSGYCWDLVSHCWLLVRYAIRPGNGGGNKRSALDILQERYARGEIGREEFEQKKHDLEN